MVDPIFDVICSLIKCQEWPGMTVTPAEEHFEERSKGPWSIQNEQCKWVQQRPKLCYRIKELKCDVSKQHELWGGGGSSVRQIMMWRFCRPKQRNWSRERRSIQRTFRTTVSGRSDCTRVLSSCRSSTMSDSLIDIEAPAVSGRSSGLPPL